VLATDNRDMLAARILRVEHRIYPDAIRLMLTVPHTIDGRRLLFQEKEGARR